MPHNLWNHNSDNTNGHDPKAEPGSAERSRREHPNGHAGNGATKHAQESRWRGIQRDYSSADVARLRGSVRIEHTLARLGAERLWNLLHTDDYVPALGALT